MSISDVSIVNLVQMLMRGISSNIEIDPIVVANHFEGLVAQLGAEYVHVDGVGYVFIDDEKMLLVNWIEEGCEFYEHTGHLRALEIIRAAMIAIQDFECGLLNEEDSDSDDLEFI